MTELLTAAQMRSLEQAAINSGEVTGLELMERAGHGVVEAVFEEWPDLARTSHRAVVLCGPGNNGGDGFVVARLLKQRGWEVEVFLFGDPDKLPPDARVNYERAQPLVETKPWNADAIERLLDTQGQALVVDAVFGTGLTRPLPTDVSSTTGSLNASIWNDDMHCVAIDLPSGLCADSGRELERAYCANLTVTFHRPKIAHYSGADATMCGKVVVKDIGLGKRWLRAAPVLLSGPTRSPSRTVADGHKYTHGHALILSGGPGKGGAARLSARGALRIGAGLVTLACPPDAIPENAARLDAIMLRPVHDADALARILEDARITALCLGPGLGTGPREAALVAAALAAPGMTRGPDPQSKSPEGKGPGSSPGQRNNRRSVVLDADALTLLSRDPALLAALHDTCVLTPHAGEFARLFPDIAERLNAPATTGPAYSKVDATREAAARAGCVVLFKGADTVIADPTGQCSINSAHYDRATPWLATAGSGDVLAGFIAGLLARGFEPMQAAETAAWLHVECARSFGPGLIAEDIPEELPKVFRALGL